jgi:hypothetical protein
MMLTPTPFDMGAIVMGTNSCAVDTVGCHMVSVDPKDLKHLVYSSEKGFGPMSLDEIEVGGDFPLDEMQEKTRTFEFCMEHVDDYFNGKSNLRCTVGTFPEAHSRDYCWGGCPGALQEAMHIFKGYDEDVYSKMKKIHYVVGEITEPLEVHDDEKIIFAGNCTSYHGPINGETVHIESSYKTTSEVNETLTKSNDMLKKTLMSLGNLFRKRKEKYIHLKGCPGSVGDHVHYISFLGKIPNPNFDSRMVFQVNFTYWQMRFFRFVNRLLSLFGMTKR